MAVKNRTALIVFFTYIQSTWCNAHQHTMIKLKEKADLLRCSQDCPPADGCWHVEAVLRLRDSEPLYPRSQPKRGKQDQLKHIVKKLFMVVPQANPRTAGIIVCMWLAWKWRSCQQLLLFTTVKLKKLRYNWYFYIRSIARKTNNTDKQTNK